jgi:anti-sigma-K factor RskA
MDINEYIASGILENYVLETASDQERQEVECMSHIYPEIKTALTSFQESIESLALKTAMPPSADLKKRILAQILIEQQDGLGEKETKVIPIQKNVTSKSTASKSSGGIYKLMAVASIILLLVVGFYAYNTNKDLTLAQSEIQDSEAVYDQMILDYKVLNESKINVSNELAALSNQMDFVGDRNTQKVALTGAADYDNNLATVFWNESSSRVMLGVQNLPALTSEESYQLWVLVDGTPFDLGVFESEILTDSVGLLEMKNTVSGDAFAITREPKGGSVSPTLEQLHVIGMVG